MQRRAQQKLSDEKLSQKIERIKKNFNALHPISATREDGIILLDEIEGILKSNIKENESAQEIEAIQKAIQNLRRDYKLDIDSNKAIHDYTGFQMGLERIKYAGWLASQEEDLDISQSESSLQGVVDKTQVNEVSSDKQTQVTNQEYLVVPFVETVDESKGKT